MKLGTYFPVTNRKFKLKYKLFYYCSTLLFRYYFWCSSQYPALHEFFQQELFLRLLLLLIDSSLLCFWKNLQLWISVYIYLLFLFTPVFSNALAFGNGCNNVVTVKIWRVLRVEGTCLFELLKSDKIYPTIMALSRPTWHGATAITEITLGSEKGPVSFWQCKV